MKCAIFDKRILNLIRNLQRKWQSKSAGQKKLFFEAYFYILYFQAVIKIFPFKKIIDLNGLEDFKGENESENLPEDARLIKWAVQAAAKFSLFKPLCLNQALTAQRMLQKRRLKGILYLGVGKDENSVKKLSAHAWIKCSDKVITGAGELEKYTVVASYTWK